MDKELQLAMDNAYQVIVEFATIDEIALSKPKEPLYLAFEEYEKCAKLKELL